jgi:hypothetical protein
MVEYLHDCIRATSGSDIVIVANITLDYEPIDNGCALVIHISDKEMYEAPGVFSNGIWSFTVPAAVTQELNGRYWYCFKANGQQLCFKEPIYFI